MKRNVFEPIEINDGLHTGAIIDVEERETKQGYNYIDLHIAFKQGEKEVALKASYPDMVSTGSKLGKVLERFGVPLVPGEECDLDMLKEKPCQFMTLKEMGKDKEGNAREYTKIITDSVKPVEV